MFQQDLFPFVPPSPAPPRAMTMTDVVRRISDHSARPRYSFMVLDLMIKVARSDGQAGPLVRDGEAHVPIREWLAAAIAPSGARHHQRRATEAKMRAMLATNDQLPDDPAAADLAVETAVSAHIRASGMTAISRAVSELVRAGLITRHYQGYCVDHVNRGAQRHAVYTVNGAVLTALNPRRVQLSQTC